LRYMPKGYDPFISKTNSSPGAHLTFQSEPSRIHWHNKPETYRMVNVFGQPARESEFLSAVKRIVSGVRNSFRQID